MFGFAKAKDGDEIPLLRALYKTPLLEKLGAVMSMLLTVMMDIGTSIC